MNPEHALSLVSRLQTELDVAREAYEDPSEEIVEIVSNLQRALNEARAALNLMTEFHKQFGITS